MAEAITKVTGSSAAYEGASRIPVQTMGQNDFLKVLVTQLTSQDPLNPTKDTDFMGQMAQFTSLEQSRMMSLDLSKMRQEQERYQASSLIGSQVELGSAGGQSETGVVSAVDFSGSETKLIINDKPHVISEVVRIWRKTN